MRAFIVRILNRMTKAVMNFNEWLDTCMPSLAAKAACNPEYDGPRRARALAKCLEFERIAEREWNEGLQARKDIVEARLRAGDFHHRARDIEPACAFDLARMEEQERNEEFRRLYQAGEQAFILRVRELVAKERQTTKDQESK